MKTKRILANIAIILALISGVILAGGCKKQPKCGCDGDALDTLVNAHVNIIYDVDNHTARFTSIYDPTSTYYFCNPSQWMSELSKFSQGEEILVSGPFFYECNYLMSASNSYYYNYYKVYQIQVTNVSAYEYGK